MDTTILQTNNLTVRFGKHTVLDNINIELKEKHIYGFIGENGAGKTTLMRVLTGLLYPSDGEFSLFGKTGPTDIIKMRKYIGSTIEAPALYPEYTAWQNLELQRVLLGNPTITRGAYEKRAILRCFTDYAVQDGYGHYQLLERVLLSKYYGHFL
ncbi:MAG: ATP-binding cassette domain-containing protein [Eubacterium sp.]